MPTAAKAALAAVKRRDPVARLGLLICLGVLVAVATCWWLWWKATDEHRVRLTLFFENTVHGLEVAAPVKIQGVPVGQVESIGVRLPTSENPGYYAAVKVVLDSDQLEQKGLPRELDNHGALKAEIARGLRGRIRILSPMAGSRYVELEYSRIDKAVFVAAPRERIAEVPALDDPLSMGLVNLSQKLAELEKRDFSAIEADINRRLDILSAAADPAGVKGANDAVLAKLAEVRAALSDEKLRARFVRVNEDLVAVRRALAGYEAKTGRGADELARAAAKLRTDLAAAAEDTDAVARALDPRSPSLLLAYSRLAVIRDNASRVRELCREVMMANGLVSTLFRKSMETEPETPAE